METLMAETLLTNVDAADKTGLEDVIRAVRDLARRSRGLAEDVAGVAERELAMVLTAAEQMRDGVTSPEALAEARKQPLLAKLRSDAHRAVDLGMDFVATGYVFGVQLVEGFVDNPRPPVAAGATTVRVDT
jgi:hypothetical protein